MSDRQHSESAEHITSAALIANILKRLHEEHALLSVSFPGDTRIYNSAIVGVDAAAGEFVLDELNPAEGHQRVRPGTRLQIAGNIAGIDARFGIEVAAVELEQDVHLYRSALPAYVIYRQRRDAVRVPVQLSLDASVTLTAPGRRIQARLSDLSASGFGAVVLSGERLTIGELYQCSIELPGQPPIPAEAEVRFALDEAGQQCRLGARFHALPLQERRRIERLVIQLQGELRRN